MATPALRLLTSLRLMRPVRALGLLAATAFVLAGCGGSQEEAGQPVQHKAIDTERFSGVAEARTVVISDAASWVALWEEHKRDQDPLPLEPRVDFSQQMVLGVFAGQRPDSCSAVVIQKVYRTPSKLVVEYAETAPDAGATCTAVVAHPSQLVTVPRGPGPVEFVKTTK